MAFLAAARAGDIRLFFRIAFAAFPAAPAFLSPVSAVATGCLLVTTPLFGIGGGRSSRSGDLLLLGRFLLVVLAFRSLRGALWQLPFVHLLDDTTPPHVLLPAAAAGISVSQVERAHSRRNWHFDMGMDAIHILALAFEEFIAAIELFA